MRHNAWITTVIWSLVLILTPTLTLTLTQVTDYVISIVPDAEGNITLSIDAAVATDEALNANVASNQLMFTYDTTSPDPTLTSVVTTTYYQNTSPVTFTVTWTEDVFEFVAADPTITGTDALPQWWSTGNGGGSVTALTGSGWQYEFEVTPAAQGIVYVYLEAAICVDHAMNDNTASGTLEFWYVPKP